MKVNKMLDELVDLLVYEFKKDKNREKIEENVVAPLLEYILNKLKPYVLGTSLFFITIILLIICILYLIIASGRKAI